MHAPHTLLYPVNVTPDLDELLLTILLPNGYGELSSQMCLTDSAIAMGVHKSDYMCVLFKHECEDRLYIFYKLRIKNGM